MKMLVLEAWCWSYGAAMWAWDHLEILLTIGILALMIKRSEKIVEKFVYKLRGQRYTLPRE
jgi:hypothetical protein